MDDPGNYRYIIDCMLNVPLLYWAAQVTGSDHYREIAAAHTATTLANSFRPDGSTYHTFFMNPDGTPKGGRTCQGYKDDSFWARGQAWGVYGSAIGYTYTHDEKFLEVFRKALDFYLSRLPEDMIPCWDMLFAPESGEPRIPPPRPSWPAACWKRQSMWTKQKPPSGARWRAGCWQASPQIMR